jgi:hypothetical protein
VIAKNADTETACRELFSRYEEHLKIDPKLVWYGDASGKSRSTKSIISDYEIIKKFFSSKGIEVNMKIQPANPSIRDSANEVNSRLKNSLSQVRMAFNKLKCPNTILSVEGTSYKVGTHEKDDSKDRDANSKVKTHLGDTVRYITHTEFPLRQRGQLVEN